MSRPTLEEFNAAVPAFQVAPSLLIGESFDYGVAPGYPNDKIVEGGDASASWTNTFTSPSNTATELTVTTEAAVATTTTTTASQVAPTQLLVGARSQRQRRPKAKSRKHFWTHKEDSILRQLVKEKQKELSRKRRKIIPWREIAQQFPGRTGKQCRERWNAQFRPGIKRGQWTSEEDELVERLRHKFGNSWSRIAREMPHRSEAAIKNRFHSQARAKQRRKQRELHRQRIADGLMEPEPTSEDDEVGGNEDDDESSTGKRNSTFSSSKDLPEHVPPIELETTFSASSFPSLDKLQNLSFDTSLVIIDKANDACLEGLDEKDISPLTHGEPHVASPFTFLGANDDKFMAPAFASSEKKKKKKTTTTKKNIDAPWSAGQDSVFRNFYQNTMTPMDKTSFIPSFAGYSDSLCKDAMMATSTKAVPPLQCAVAYSPHPSRPLYHPTFASLGGLSSQNPYYQGHQDLQRTSVRQSAFPTNGPTRDDVVAVEPVGDWYQGQYGSWVRRLPTPSSTPRMPRSFSPVTTSSFRQLPVTTTAAAVATNIPEQAVPRPAAASKHLRSVSSSSSSSEENEANAAQASSESLVTVDPQQVS